MSESTSRITRIPPPREGTWFWYVLWGIAWFLRLFCARVVAEGRENLPASGGYVVTCNHTRGFDYVPLGYCSPRQAYFLVKAEAFEVNPILTWILHNGGGIPVKRGKADTLAIQQSIAKVNEGRPAAIFPEGTRSPDGTLQAAYTGAVRVALHTNTPVVPAVVIGAEEMLRQIRKPWVRPLVTVRYGTPIWVTGDPADKMQVAAETRRVMLAMAAMLPPNMRGVWADGVGRIVGAGETRAQRARRAADQAAITQEQGTAEGD
jgi:1-acyl-sn-glycerol-3-phosphate acyltransferase